MFIEKETMYLVPLLKDLGYLLVKLKLIRFHNGGFGANLVYVSNFHYDQVGDKKTLPDFSDHDLLISPLTMIGLPSISSLDKWVKIRKLENHEDNYQLPDFRETNGLPLIIDEEEDQHNWYLIKDNDINRRIFKPYAELKHLGYYELLSQRLINIRLTIEWLKNQGEPIENYFNKDELEEHYFSRMLNRVKNSLQYKEIPIEKRSKFEL